MLFAWAFTVVLLKFTSMIYFILTACLNTLKIQNFDNRHQFLPEFMPEFIRYCFFSFT